MALLIPEGRVDRVDRPFLVNLVFLVSPLSPNFLAAREVRRDLVRPPVPCYPSGLSFLGFLGILCAHLNLETLETPVLHVVLEVPAVPVILDLQPFLDLQIALEGLSVRLHLGDRQGQEDR